MKKPEIRYLYEMKDVIYDKEWLKRTPNLALYYIWRGVKKKKGLRYDITVLPARMLGEEFVKTKGHEHSNKYSELYIVLQGEAIYLLQKGEKERVVDVYAVKAKKGEMVIIPASYGHLTINPSRKDLKEANWISENCQNRYGLFEKMGGACYFYTKSGWIRNKNYKKVPKLRFEKPLKKIPKNLDFLKG